MSEATHSQQASKRPAWVWIISAFFVVSAGYTILSYLMVYSGSTPLTAAQRAYFSSLSFFDHAVTISIASLNIAGAVLLFLLKRTAPFLFLSAFTLGILVLAYQMAAKNWLSAINGPGLVGAVIGQLLLVAVVLYSFNLRKRGTLR